MKKRRKIWSFAWNILLFAAVLLAAEAWQSRHMIRGPLPGLLRSQSLPTLRGSTHSLWSPEKMTVVYVFAPWCGVCRMSGRNVERLPDGFQKAALALSWSQPSEVEEFVQASGLQVPVLMGRDEEAVELGIQAYPSYLILDTRGNIVRAWSGYTTTFGLWLRTYAARLWAIPG